jgi:regulator of sirC expression with transglutaminase-like and TPR domain
MSLLQRPNVRVEDVAIVIAKEANPLLDDHAVRRGLDGLGAEVLIRRGLRSTPERDGRILAELLFQELGFEGERDDYYNPYNSYLDKVLIRRKGIPISLSVLTMAQDPFHGGELLDGQGLRKLAGQFLGAEMALHPSYLEPVDCLTITIRMLANLKNAHRRQGDYARAMLACDHLVELTQAPEHRRDRGLLAHALRTYGAASEDLAAYLEARPDAKDAHVISRALEEAREQADQVLH